MIENRILLSIAIPTYNRSSNLQTLYEDFIGIVEKKCSGNIEIIICDNSDKKDAKRNQNIFSQTSIRYFKNKKNIGFTNNVIQCFKRAKGEFLWIISDDDILNPDHFLNFLEKLEDISQSNHDCIMLPFLNSDGLGREYVSNDNDTWNVQETSSLVEIMNKNNQFPFVLFSSAIIRLNNFDQDKIKAIRNQFEGNDYIQIPLFIEAIGLDAKIYFYDDILIEYNASKDIRFDIKKMMFSMKDIINYYLSDNKKSKKRYLKRYYRSYVGLYLLHKASLYKVRGVESFKKVLISELRDCISLNNLFLTGLIFFPAIILRTFFRINQFFLIKRNQSL